MNPPKSPRSPAVFLDRDGVLIEDTDLLTRVEQLRILPGVPEALQALKMAGFQLVVVTNQPVIARGMTTERGVEEVHLELARRIMAAGGPAIDRFYLCPHHPQATLPEYRMNCQCRKPRPGMFRQAIMDLALDPRASFTVGDRITDIIAGAAVGSRTVLVETGKHTEAPITTGDALDHSIKPEHTCADLRAAADWIIKAR